jgi:hypothetical protein
MRIAYVAKGNFASGAGVLRKIDGQTGVWRGTGNETRLFALTTATAGNIRPLCPADVILAGRGTSRFSACRELLSRIARWQPDVVYLRYCSYQPGFSALFELAPVVIEINADDTKEIRLVSRKSHFYNLATRRRQLSRASGFAFVTNELAESPSFSDFAAPRVVIGNGISLSEIPCRLAPQSRTQPRLFFIGSPNFGWHGVDKMSWLASHRPSWHFDVVGMSEEQKSSVPANMDTHGLLAKDRYIHLLLGADVAISTLALHRNGLDEASPLKTREYLAAGVPTIIGYRDTDFPDDAPFLLRLPNVEENVLRELERIDAFVHRMRGVTVSRESVEHLDWSRKEPARLDLFREVLARRHDPS